MARGFQRNFRRTMKVRTRDNIARVIILFFNFEQEGEEDSENILKKILLSGKLSQ